MAEITKTIKPSGGDYTSLSGWNAGEQTDLVTDGDIAIAECYVMNDTTICTLSGWITGVNNYIKMYTPTSERHDGKWDTSAYRLIVTDDKALIIAVDYVYIDGLQIGNINLTGNSKHVLQINAIGVSNLIQISNTLIKGHGNATYLQRVINVNDTNTILEMWNCIVYNSGTNSSSILMFIKSSTADIYNCTFCKGYFGVFYNAGTVTVENSISCDNNDDFAGGMTIDYCASDDGDGTNAQTLDSTNSYEDEFTDFDNDDFSLVSGSVCEENGTNDPGSGLYDDDIIGTIRS
jgi:hypothetical protein